MPTRTGQVPSRVRSCAHPILEGHPDVMEVPECVKEDVPIIEVFGQPVSGEDHVSRLGGAPIGNPVSDVDHRFLCAMAREVVTLAAPAAVLTILPTLGPANRGPIGMKEGIVTLDG
jgi:hypothetical protein